MTEQPHPYPFGTLVTVGLVAGSGATYAFTSTPTRDLPATVSGSGRGANPVGGPRDGAGPADGTQPDQRSDGTTTDGEPT